MLVGNDRPLSPRRRKPAARARDERRRGTNASRAASRVRLDAHTGRQRRDGRDSAAAMGASRVVSFVTNGACRFEDARPARGVRAQHRELHRHGEGAGRPRRSAARERRSTRTATTTCRSRRPRRRWSPRTRAGRSSSPRPAAARPLVLNEGVSRAPRGSPSRRLPTPRMFVAWASQSSTRFQAGRGRRRPGTASSSTCSSPSRATTSTSQLEFTTGDASGQNMVTIATEAICRYIEERSAGPAAVLVRRGEHVRRQESDDPVLHVASAARR